eukprot:GHVL01001234.1.p1 GENE.GHVL01001234.1~~GHVL01001234.1.p1  ORF type:complete len:469 (-),score=121.26 GHVL01001234.1:55-1461(-)
MALQVTACGTRRDPIGSVIKRKKNNKIKNETIIGEQKDTQLCIFHAIGKFLYCKRIPPPGYSETAQNIISKKKEESTDYWEPHQTDWWENPGFMNESTTQQLADKKLSNCSTKCDESVVDLIDDEIDDTSIKSIQKSIFFIRKNIEKNYEKIDPIQLNNEYLVPKCKRPELYFQPEEIITKLMGDAKNFVAFLQYNYPYFFGSLNDIARCATLISFVDSCYSFKPFSTITNIDSFITENEIYYTLVSCRAISDSNLHPCKPTFDSRSNESTSSGGRFFNFQKPFIWDSNQCIRTLFCNLNSYWLTHGVIDGSIIRINFKLLSYLFTILQKNGRTNNTLVSSCTNDTLVSLINYSKSAISQILPNWCNNLLSDTIYSNNNFDDEYEKLVGGGKKIIYNNIYNNNIYNNIYDNYMIVDDMDEDSALDMLLADIPNDQLNADLANNQLNADLDIVHYEPDEEEEEDIENVD